MPSSRGKDHGLSQVLNRFLKTLTTDPIVTHIARFVRDNQQFADARFSSRELRPFPLTEAICPPDDEK